MPPSHCGATTADRTVTSHYLFNTPHAVDAGHKLETFLSGAKLAREKNDHGGYLTWLLKPILDAFVEEQSEAARTIQTFFRVRRARKQSALDLATVDFGVIDRNGDGNVTRHELIAAVIKARMPQNNQERLRAEGDAERAFDSMDTDKSGRVDVDEFLTARSALSTFS